MASIATMNPLRERFNGVVASLSERDRRLLMGLIAFVMIAALGFGWWTARGLLGDARGRVADREETLALVKDLGNAQGTAAAQVKSIEEELRKNAGQDLPAFMEKTAAKVGISTSLAAVREKEAHTEGTLEEKIYSVELSKMNVQQLTDFLYEAETGGYPLRIRSMKTKTVTAQGVKMLNVSLEVSAFRLVEDAAAAAPTDEENTP